MRLLSDGWAGRRFFESGNQEPSFPEGNASCVPALKAWPLVRRVQAIVSVAEIISFTGFASVAA